MINNSLYQLNKILKKMAIQLTSAIFLLTLALLIPSQIKAVGPELSISPQNNTYYLGQEFVIDVNFNSNGNQHRETYLELDFDNAALEVLSVEQQELYWNYQDLSLGNDTGTFKLRGDFNGNSYSQSGLFAKIKMRVLNDSGITTLLMNTNSHVLNSAGEAYAETVFSGASFDLQSVQSSAMIRISSDYNIWALNDTRWVIFDLDTRGNQVAGVDLVIRYDQNRFQYQSMNWHGLFSNQQGFSVNQSEGIITISGIINHNQPINTKGKIMSVSFQALQTGASDFSLDWTSGSTTDTNVVAYDEVNQDLLTSAPTPLSITVDSNPTIDLSFSLLDYLGNPEQNPTRTASVTVTGTGAVSIFSHQLLSGLNEIFGHSLGTFAFGNEYQLVLKVPGYLKESESRVLNVGYNGLVEFGQLRPGDLNADGVINSSDLWQVYNSWNNTSIPIADLNADGKVNSFDVGILYKYFNEVDNI